MARGPLRASRAWVAADPKPVGDTPMELVLSCLVSRPAAMESSPLGNRQRCGLCQVEIESIAPGHDVVHFSMGAPGTRAKLWARVCQYLSSPDQCARCLNQDAALRGSVATSDYYAEAPSFELGMPSQGNPLG